MLGIMEQKKVAYENLLISKKKNVKMYDDENLMPELERHKKLLQAKRELQNLDH